MAHKQGLARSLIKRLSQAVGKQWLLTEPADLICYSTDASGFRAMPQAVALPGNTEQLCELLSICHSEAIAVYPRGAGSGTVGGAVPVQGGLVVATVRMNHMGEFSRVDLSCRVGPGAITGQIQKRAESMGLFYPPDPASLAFCTIGGNVATCAGGARAVKYGVTRDYVRALDLVLPSGELVHLGSEAAKSVAGLDLVRTVVGSEGLLGMISGITLRLLPRPEAVGTSVALFSQAPSALMAVTRLFERGIVPRCAEFMDRMSLDAIRGQLPFPVEQGVGAMLLVEVDGTRSAAAEQARLAAEEMKRAGAVYVEDITGSARVDEVWRARRGLSPAIRRLGFSRKVSEDISVPRSRLFQMLEFLEELSRPEAAILTFGHAGDGNLHVNLLLTQATSGDDALIHDIVKQIMERCLELGGTISGEHGIGLAKRDFLPLEHGPRVLGLESSVKGLFDPKGIMNPGKVFEPGRSG